MLYPVELRVRGILETQQQLVSLTALHLNYAEIYHHNAKRSITSDG
jgi:hypothetical protein